jgi:hypothetical protein
MRRVSGLGERKLADLGDRFIECITTYCRRHGLPAGVPDEDEPQSRRRKQPNATTRAAWEMFRRGASIGEVMTALGRARSTTTDYLARYVAHHAPASVEPWVNRSTYERVAAAASTAADGRLKTIYDALGGSVPYDEIKLVLTHLRARGAMESGSAHDAPD